MLNFDLDQIYIILLANKMDESWMNQDTGGLRIS